MKRFVVIGAGIIGACVALALRRDGHVVDLVDRDEPGMGCSFGNAGFIQTGTPHPMASPGILRRLPTLLLDPESPLSIRWRHLPRLAPWLLRFLAAASPARVEAISIAMMALLARSGDAYGRVLADAGAADLVTRRGLLFVYPDDASLAAAEWEFDLYRRRGVEVVRLSGAEAREMEPALNPGYAHAYHLPETFFTVDPLLLTRHIVDRFVDLGGNLRRAEARDIEIGAQGATGVVTADTRLDADAVVLCAGIHSRAFAERLGDAVPLESARGYHLMISDPGVALNGPVIDGILHFGATPMREGLRLAGTLELASLEAPENWRRADMLLPHAIRMLPGLDAVAETRWMGHRPALPDSLPVLARAGRVDNVFYAFGHGQLGLTMAAATGEVIADLAAGRDPGIDLTPYRADRF